MINIKTEQITIIDFDCATTFLDDSNMHITETLQSKFNGNF